MRPFEVFVCELSAASVWSSIVMHGTAQGLRDLGVYGVFACRHWFNVVRRSSVLYRRYPLTMSRRLVFRSEHPTEWSSEQVHAATLAAEYLGCTHCTCSMARRGLAPQSSRHSGATCSSRRLMCKTRANYNMSSIRVSVDAVSHVLRELP